MFSCRENLKPDMFWHNKDLKVLLYNKIFFKTLHNSILRYCSRFCNKEQNRSKRSK